MRCYAIISVALSIALTATPVKAQNDSDGDKVSFIMNAEGDIEYTSDFSVDTGYNMYVAVYNAETRTLEAVDMNKASGIIEVDAGKEYNVASYFWKNNMEPVLTPVTVNNLSVNSIYKLSTKQAVKGNSVLSLSENVLTMPSGQQIELAEQIDLADANAGSETKALYSYLKAMGQSDSILFGQQNNISHKAGSTKLSDSDTYDITGDYSAICGLDTLSLTGDEYSAYVCNNRYGTEFPRTAKGNVLAAAYLTNKAIDNGAIITLSSHMPNFSVVSVKDNAGTESYAKFDFSGYSPNVLTGDIANGLLEGGQYNEKFNAYLDMIADYAGNVNGAILFRPFHENTGDWFWWGAKFCDAEQYKKIYAYTVKYLRDTKGVHNLLYVYSSGSEFTSAESYETYYPGDDYVDIVGFDLYSYKPDGGKRSVNLRKTLSGKLQILSDFAERHDKVCALTETGVSNPLAEGDSQTAFLKSENPEPDWYTNTLEMLNEYPLAYFMLWSNFGETNGFYTPYVRKVNSDGTLFGHEMIDNFIEFYNDGKSVFASDQKDVLTELRY